MEVFRVTSGHAMRVGRASRRGGASHDCIALHVALPHSEDELAQGFVPRLGEMRRQSCIWDSLAARIVVCTNVATVWWGVPPLGTAPAAGPVLGVNLPVAPRRRATVTTGFGNGTCEQFVGQWACSLYPSGIDSGTQPQNMMSPLLLSTGNTRLKLQTFHPGQYIAHADCKDPTKCEYSC